MCKNNIFIVLFLISSGLFSCQFNASNSWKNETIPSSIRFNIKNLNTKLVSDLKNGNIKDIKKTFSKPMLEQTKESNFSDELLIFKDILKNDSFNLIDEFYTKNLSTNSTNILSGDHYNFGFVALNKEMYVSIIEVESNSNSSYLLGIVYGKYDSKWEVNILQIGQYKLDGKNALDFYMIARKQYLKDHFVDSANNIFLADQLLFPLKNYWTYREHEGIQTMFESVVEEIHNTISFPLELEEIQTKPQLFGISPQVFAEGIYPIISYKSNIDIKDTIKLKKEYLEVNKSIDIRFSGIHDENSTLIYKVWEEIPDGKTPINNYSFIHKN